VEKFWTHTGHRWEYNTVHAQCMLDKWGYKHILKIWFLIFFHGNNGYANAPPYYFIRKMPFLLTVKLFPVKPDFKLTAGFTVYIGICVSWKSKDFHLILYIKLFPFQTFMSYGRTKETREMHTMFCWENLKTSLWRQGRRWNDNIKMDIQRETGFICFGLGTRCELLETWLWNFGVLIKRSFLTK